MSSKIQMKYEDSIDNWRREKDVFFKRGHDSPIPEVERKRFVGLKYFPPDKKYRFEVNLQRHDSPAIVTMVTSKGTQQRFQRYGYFELEVKKKVQLQAYKAAEREDDSLFIPFRDRTSGKESYAGARYLDLHMQPDDDYVLDFNLAYSPYCAYSEEYICPLPPRENWLDVEIRAGEMKYHD
jgi:uncharacterized protein (DUF1684 family)